jgi:hypothetical protein
MNRDFLHRLIAAGAAVFLGMAFVLAQENPPAGSRKASPLPASATLVERIRPAYVARYNRDDVEELIRPSFSQPHVERREQFIKKIVKWAADLPPEGQAEILILEVVLAAPGPPIPTYDRIVLCRADDWTVSFLEPMKPPAEERRILLDAEAWQVVKPFADRATRADIVGEYRRPTSIGFDVIIVSYFDGRKWNVTEYRQCQSEGFLDNPSAKALVDLENLMFYGLITAFWGPNAFNAEPELLKQAELLQGLQEKKKSASKSPSSK